MITAALLAFAAIGASADQPVNRMRVIELSYHDRFASQIDSWFDRGDYPRCISLLRIQSRMYTIDEDSLTNLGFLLESIEASDEALSNYIWFKKQNPNTGNGPYPEADFYFRGKAFSKVPPLLEPTLKFKPHPNNYRELAHAYERMGLFAQAERVWKQCIQVYPQDGAAVANLKKMQARLKQK